LRDGLECLEFSLHEEKEYMAQNMRVNYIKTPKICVSTISRLYIYIRIYKTYLVLDRREEVRQTPQAEKHCE